MVFKVNSDLHHRNALFLLFKEREQQQPTCKNNNTYRLPPGLLQHEYMANIINILYSDFGLPKESESAHSFICNY
jgi:hypothetical protein